MLTYRNRDSAAVLTLSELVAAHPDYAFPPAGPDDAMLGYLGYDAVFATPAPTLHPWQTAIAGDPVLTGKGIWERSWTVADQRAGLTVAERRLFHARLREERLEAANTLRKTHETAGIVLDGDAIATDRESQSMISGGYALARDMLAGGVPTEPIDFKAANGWVKLSAERMVAIGRSTGLYVQACFRQGRALDDRIGAIDPDADDAAETLFAIDLGTGWPEREITA